MILSEERLPGLLMTIIRWRGHPLELHSGVSNDGRPETRGEATAHCALTERLCEHQGQHESNLHRKRNYIWQYRFYDVSGAGPDRSVVVLNDIMD
ncbi:uncharacterized protein LOC117221996 isoform X1 [Megalopta genalis]|uniref:uncharacterized protein LOC117221996 isoform X1 n=1 Tax=Megalopta genalis TaxID=115081 RepID=UPI003FCEF713